MTRVIGVLDLRFAFDIALVGRRSARTPGIPSRAPDWVRCEVLDLLSGDLGAGRGFRELRHCSATLEPAPTRKVRK